MRTCWLLLGLSLLAGCSHTVDPPSTSAAAIQNQPAAQPDEFDFKDWPKATASPFRVDIAVAFACEAPSFGPHPRRSGPHVASHIVVRVNPEAIEDFKAKRPLKVGSIVIKEKHNDGSGNNPPHAFTAMIQREPGYDPEHGDWEYAEVRLLPEKKVVARGKIATCIACHDQKKDDGYLFRDYMK